MNPRPKTEAEQVAFFDGVHERFLHAVSRVGDSLFIEIEEVVQL